MSNLIRLTTQDENGFFNTNLSEGVLLKPNAQIALQSASFARNSPVFTMDSTSDTFLFSTDSDDAGNEREIRVDNPFPATITALAGRQPHPTHIGISEFNNFLSTITRQLNTSLDNATDADVGVQALCSVRDKDNKVEIDVRRQAFSLISGNAAGVANRVFNFNVANNASVLSKAATQPPATDDGLLDGAVFADRLPLGKGCSIFSARIRNFTGPVGNNGAFMGLIKGSNYHRIKNGRSLRFQDFHCGINVVSSVASDANPQDAAAPKIRIVVNDASVGNVGGTTDSLITDLSLGRVVGGGHANHDILSIEIQGGHAKLFQYAKLGTANYIKRELLVSATGGDPANQEQGLNIFSGNRNLIEEDEEYYAVICFRSQNIQLDQVQVINNPFFGTLQELQPALRSFGVGPVGLGAFPDMNQPGHSKISIRFRSSPSLRANTTLMNFLGFNQPDLNVLNPVSVSQIKFIGDNEARASLKSEMYLIQLVSIPLESYDEVGGGQYSTLYTIVKQVDITDTQEVNFNSNYPIFINVKNKHPLRLQQVRARIVDSDLKSVPLLGRSQLTLLVKNKE
jgi:hypothetical protein